MPMPFIDHFSGWEGQTCSYTTDFITKNADAAKAAGMSEADYRKQLLKSHLGFIQAEVEQGAFKPGSIAFRAKKMDGSETARVVWDGTEFKFQSKKMADIGAPEGVGFNATELKAIFESDSKVWDYTVPTHRSSPVSFNSNSVGALTDEDAAILFVKTKDDFAKMKGINIKGANPQLDLEVYEALAKQVGYEATELAAKVEQYKATGHKLSGLKKKVVKDESLYTKALAKKKASLPDPPPPQVYDGNVIYEVKKPDLPAPDTKTMFPTQEAVDEAIDALIEADLKNTLVYKDEDVVKAYIKAKDQVAADPSNKWTLYTKGDDFDAAIYHLMSKEYGVDLTGDDIKQHIANYLGSGNKVSVLKKKMIKQGELDPAADTLKKTKAQKQFDTAPTHSVTEAKSQIDDMAKTAETPVGATPVTIGGHYQVDIFQDLKNSIYQAMSPESAWAKFEQMAVKMRKELHNDNISALDIIRIYDKKKAAQLGIENGNFYEKKVAEWASSPAGKAHIIQQKAAIEAQAKAAAEAKTKAEAKAKAEEAILKSINDNMAPLPADSAMYQVISESKARSIQDMAEPWTAQQKEGLRHYTGGSYTPMNQFLRGQTSHITATNRMMINSAQQGMRPVTEGFLVRRGAGYSSFDIGTAGKYGFDATDHAKFKAMVGKTVEEKGFLSTSVGGEGAFGGSVKIEVEITPGTYGAYVDHISQHRGEREFMVAHGTKYQVLRVEATTGYGGSLNQTVIRLRTIPGSHSKGSV